MPKQALEISLDRIDLRILSHLQNNARITNTELADAVGLSPSPCLRRVKALEAHGVLKHYAGIVDAKAVGLPISVFVSVSLNRQEQQGLQDFEETVSDYIEVMECYLMTGSSDYLLRVVVPDLESYERFLTHKLTRINGIANIQSSFALKQVVYKTELPLASED
ncbi:Lrp/AsnC family transcriptional regulator [Oceanicoccus sagamiensis]|uniref:ArsR family transcriptional regulator n=1 Tax=Oceanicoccus sagamiensis TaxID=716816 RepID=A0A1X9NER8_9GAMM|nr:Lrp/AsnC family transcriptional regulator [Oceanicoccus sagamiensis]ARN73437.1 ArsR family transcriptional regulator [Oceanicoccus sagamiensis]